MRSSGGYGRFPAFVPASMSRVRCFLNTKGGMKVKPWTTVEETLDVLHDLLVTRIGDEEFWRGLGELLEQLSADMARRAGRGDVVGNEILSPGRCRALLGELRRAAGVRVGTRGGFLSLAKTLSPPALGLLFLLGGVSTAGCEHEQRIGGDAAVDTSVLDAVDEIEPRVDAGCVNEGLTFEEIIEECVAEADERASIFECVGSLHESWRQGLREYFECKSCDQIAEDIELCLFSGRWLYCSDPEHAGEFDLDAFLDNCASLIYLGVRFE